MQNLQVVEVQGKRVLTTKQIAELYDTEIIKVQQNFRNNKENYQLGKHYIELSGKALQELKANSKLYDQIKYAKRLYLWTEKGALLHAKSLNTDKAWEVYDYLVDFYFRAQDEKKIEGKAKQDELRQQEAEKKAVIPVNTRTEKIPDAIEEKTRTIPVYGFNPAKAMVVDIPKNKEALQLIKNMRKYLTGMDAVLDTYCMYLNEEEFKKIAYAVRSMASKISNTALDLYTFKPHIVEEYL